MEAQCSEQWRQKLEEYLKNRAEKGPSERWMTKADYWELMEHVAQCEACRTRHQKAIVALRRQTEKPPIAKQDTTRNFRTSLLGPPGFLDFF